MRILLASFAFPPLLVQMSPVAVRAATELRLAGYSVDVICAERNVWPLPEDQALVGFAEGVASQITRMSSRSPADSRWRRLIRRFCDVPDHMAPVISGMRDEILSRGADRYDAIVSISPFHSVNHSMMQVKRAWPDVPWVAFFGDPWADNPLERRRIIALWNAFFEPRALRMADYVVQTSSVALEQVRRRHPDLKRDRLRVVHHTFDSRLYPSGERRSNPRFTLRYLGSLYGGRSPLPVLRAVERLVTVRPEMKQVLALEFIGEIEAGMSAALGASPVASLIAVRPPVGYLRSLELMYGADALLMIEANIADTPFMPSKLTDYLGADRPILGIVPRGECRDILAALGAPVHDVFDVDGIARSIEAMVERPSAERASWCNQDLRRSFDLRERKNGLAALVNEACRL